MPYPTIARRAVSADAVTEVLPAVRPLVPTPRAAGDDGSCVSLQRGVPRRAAQPATARLAECTLVPRTSPMHQRCTAATSVPARGILPSPSTVGPVYMPEPVRHVSRDFLTRYRGSDRLADLLLTGTYHSFLYQPTVKRPERLAQALACLLLAELVLDGALHLTGEGHLDLAPAVRLHPHRIEVEAAYAGRAILRDVRAEPASLPVARWIAVLARDGRATALVWERLIARGVAREAAPRRWRRRRAFELVNDGGAGIVATDWMRSYLPTVVTADRPVPDDAAVLWRVIGLLDLTGREFEIPASTADRLDVSAPPVGLARLLRALEESLLALSAHL
ncbi:hypothetical protein [Amycolatopsis sp. H20-H5]|uniref:hypothetical protein n=1 Tax=Amycolatopsis sp. H20-H5 TaxID=3046309 RepID=UPI002DBB9DB4|nr:hypothetical protein [Amycolatopsis sp. H20-H5]MEC3977766.1 hypothetical protein [Amycolatopsis sp. H20-H5]